jgi:hypothetical protein
VVTVRFEQPGARIPSTPEEIAAYLARKTERLTVEGEAHHRAAEAIAALRQERGAGAEGEDVLSRLEGEARDSAVRAFRAALLLVDTTPASDRADGSSEGS